MSETPVYYNQKNPEWVNNPYPSVVNKGTTIGTSGCGPTCAAMVIATLREPTITPIDTCAWAAKYSYHTQGTELAYFKPQMEHYGIPCEYTWYLDKALAALEAGFMVIGRAGPGLWTSGGHYILAYGVSGSDILVNDPNSISANKSRAQLYHWNNEVKPFWIIREDWKMLEFDKLTDTQVDSLLARISKRLNSQEPAPYAMASCAKAVKSKIFSDGDNDGLIDNPNAFMTRAMTAVVLDRAGLFNVGDEE